MMGSLILGYILIIIGGILLALAVLVLNIIKNKRSNGRSKKDNRNYE
jgi:uncharacterized integral membrane protein